MKRSAPLKRSPLQRKGKPLARRRKTPRAKLLQRCDDAWKLVVRHRAGWMCEYEGCDKAVHLHAHHVRSRQWMKLAFEPRNGCLLCFYHHLTGPMAAHKDPLGFTSWFKTYRFEDYCFLMRAEHTTPAQYGRADLERIATELEAQVLEFEELAA